MESFIRNELGGHQYDIEIYHIESWPDTQLHHIIAGRLNYYYDIGPKEVQEITLFKHLCNADYDVDTRLIKAAKGSPRKLIEIIKAIIDAHCAVISNPKTLIFKDTIDNILRPYER